mgnify:FL=1
MLANSLLKTKTNVPVLGEQLVERQRLIEQLEKGSKIKLTFLSAPAGFGKTTVLSQWLKNTKRKAAWLSLDIGDNKLSRFLIYLITALQTIKPDLGAEIIPILNLSDKPQID